MRHFVIQSIKGGRCGSYNQYYKSTDSDEVFNNISKELNVIGKVCEIIDKDFEYTNKSRKTLENEYDWQFNGYGDINQEERSIYINNKLSKSIIHKELQKLNLNVDVMMDYDGNSLYPSAMWDENSVYP